MNDRFDLRRFVAAQDAGGTYEQALREIRAGRKASHWMWFVFPQLAGLGRSDMARRYALSGPEEARAYLAHPLLGSRLGECARALLSLGGTDPVPVLGGIDARKLHSSMTLFARTAPEPALFADVLDRYFGGREDRGTTELLEP